MIRRFLSWLHNRPRSIRFRGRLVARSLIMTFPEILTADPGTYLWRQLETLVGGW